MFTEQLTQALSVQGNVVPTNASAGNVNTITAIDMSRFKRIIGLLDVGVCGNAANVAMYWQGCNTNNGTYVNITGSSVVLTANNSQGTLELRSDQLPTGNRYVQLGVIVTSNTAFFSAWAFGSESAYKPANQFDLSNTNGIINTGATRTVTA